MGGEIAGVEGKIIEALLERHKLRKHDQFSFAGRKAPPVAEKTERETRRKFEILDQKAAALWKNMFALDLDRLSAGHVNEMTQRSAHYRRSPKPLSKPTWQNRQQIVGSN